MWAILATGSSLAPEQVESVRHLRVIAVSDAYRLAPWAEVLVSADAAWWKHHAPEFKGRRFSNSAAPDTERIAGLPSGTNSGAFAIKVARHLGAKEIILLGFDGGSTHFFGPHPTPLQNTSPQRLTVHHNQHRAEAFECYREGVKVWNCSPGTAITHYPTARLDECLKPSVADAQARTNLSCAA